MREWVYELSPLGLTPSQGCYGTEDRLEKNNAMVYQYHYPLPKLHETLDTQAGKQYFMWSYDRILPTRTYPWSKEYLAIARILFLEDWMEQIKLWFVPARWINGFAWIQKRTFLSDPVFTMRKLFWIWMK